MIDVIASASTATDNNILVAFHQSKLYTLCMAWWFYLVIVWSITSLFIMIGGGFLPKKYQDYCLFFLFWPVTIPCWLIYKYIRALKGDWGDEISQFAGLALTPILVGILLLLAKL